jgi:undecaprenyl-diphosphatase
LRPLPAVLLAVALLQPVVALDEQVQSAVQRQRSPVLDRVMQAATELGRRDLVAGVLLGVAILDPVAGPAVARLTIVGLAGTNLVVEGLKWTVNRPRPDGERKRSNSSFPSSHAASGVCVAWIFARRWPRLAWGWWALALVVAWSRIYLNRHYLSDVVCGIAVGLVCTALVLRVKALDPRAGGRLGPRTTEQAPAP